MTTSGLRQLLAEDPDPIWFAHPNDLIGGWCVMPCNGPPGETGTVEIADFVTERRAKLIVALRNAMPGLLEHCDCLEEENARLRKLAKLQQEENARVSH